MSQLKSEIDLLSNPLRKIYAIFKSDDPKKHLLIHNNQTLG